MAAIHMTIKSGWTFFFLGMYTTLAREENNEQRRPAVRRKDGASLCGTAVAGLVLSCFDDVDEGELESFLRQEVEVGSDMK